ncbi:spinocerebellar ataxia type 10 protein domain-containing protein [Fomitopsis serialis]|uniref:spinocerebellar ataxia type 10 protein domain-containing protein n=1 Tax=Fomitopsis serialis TaxID=139415 RepID=UPI002008E7D2|nr:spinocerebellar ataxia type 10 protein domain-containing protein [Neoantrodia serialis]KAH9915726.1 spinocerebellar ataxia type 10 protein domain-containing protein [Neoantrodia serialis]
MLLQSLWNLMAFEHIHPNEGDPADTALRLSVARFTRNIVAGVPNNQDRVFENESLIRSLLYRYTSYSAVQDPATYPTTRMLVQTLSNLVTGNDPLIAKLWKLYLTLPEEQLVLLREDVSSTLVLILNCVHSHNERMEMLGDAIVHRFELFTQIIEAGLVPALYKAISITHHSPTNTLLKLLDSYLHKSSQGLPAKARNDALRTTERSEPENGVGVESTPSPLKELDLLLPKVSEALVLVSQCLTTLALASSTAHLISLTETLRLLDLFLPRITFGKVVERPSPPGMRPPPADTVSSTQSGVEGFSYVKRDLVRLLGIIALDDNPVQDRVRECGGIPVVMNLCVIDDRNPCEHKEHAILALRNLLHGNKANQDAVREIQPVARWDERGVLQSLSRYTK